MNEAAKGPIKKIAYILNLCYLLLNFLLKFCKIIYTLFKLCQLIFYWNIYFVLKINQSKGIGGKIR